MPVSSKPLGDPFLDGRLAEDLRGLIDLWSLDMPGPARQETRSCDRSRPPLGRQATVIGRARPIHRTPAARAPPVL
ncbi:hypothetical protein BD413DRAFT_515885 [Trametes elegans]|nr:hypothetical protein BD413DRAFT_515885 [Trametes elegans]